MTTNPDPFNLTYRVEVLEKWREMLEQEGIAKTLAVMEERQRVMNELVLHNTADIAKLKSAQDKSEGGRISLKALVTYGVATVILGGSLIIQAVQAFGG